MSNHLQRKRITQYIQDTYGTAAEYLWADSPGNAIFRHPASKKWYAAMMWVRPEKLGLTGEEPLDVMDIKQYHHDRVAAVHKRISSSVPHEQKSLDLHRSGWICWN